MKSKDDHLPKPQRLINSQNQRLKGSQLKAHELTTQRLKTLLFHDLNKYLRLIPQN